MKAIIKGKRYDTETAELIASWDNGLGYSDLNHIEEELYRTPKGKFFLVGGGGAASKWSQPARNGRSGSSGNFVPLTDEQAIEYLEKWDEVEAIEKYFPAHIEDA